MFHLNSYQSEDLNFNFNLNSQAFWMYEAILYMQLPISYCVSLIVVTITRHVCINFFQMEQLSDVLPLSFINACFAANNTSLDFRCAVDVHFSTYMCLI